MKFQIKARNNLRGIPLLMVGGIILLIVAWLIDFIPVVSYTFLVAFCVAAAPVLFLHIEYYMANKGMVIQLSGNGVSISDSKGNQLHYSNAELARIEFFKSANIDKGGVPQFLTELYFYARIIPKHNKPDVIITCLMTSGKLEEIYELKGVPVEVRRTPFASIRFPLGLSKPIIFETK